MTKQTIDNLQPGTLDGDSLFRTAEKINENFNEIYSHFGDGQNLDEGYAGIKGLNAGIISSAGAGGYNVREIIAGSTAVSVTNGTGAAGNPTIDLPDTGVLPAGSSNTVFADQGITVDTKGRIIALATPTLLTSSQTQANNAAASATAAATSATASATSATASATSASAAASDVATIGSSVSTAATHASNAGTSATAAAGSATTATTQVGLATTQATNSSNSATAASTSATNAGNSATAAGTSETNAGNSATAAATSATNATNAKTAAESAKTAAETAFDNFDDIYLGNKSSAPSADNDGDALAAGMLYFDTTANELKVYNGSAWQGGVTAAGGFMSGTNNLSDLNNAATSRTNLGLGSIATQASATVLQTSNNLSDVTAATARTNLGLDTLLAAKAPLASPALTGTPTIGGTSIKTIATSAAYSDLTGAPTHLNVTGGSAGTIPYQTAANTTGMSAVGTAGQVLSSNGTGAPTWIDAASGGGASNAKVYFFGSM